MRGILRLGMLGLVLCASQARAEVVASAELQTDAPVYGVPLSPQSVPAVAFSGGRGVAVWWGLVTTNTFGEFARRFAGQDSTPLDQSPVLLGTQGGGAVGQPDVACAANQCLAVWDSSNQILGRRLDLNDGSLLDAAPIVISSGSGARDKPRVAAVAGAYYVVWNDGRSSSSYIMGSAVSAEGVVGSPAGSLIAQGLNTRQEVAIAGNDSSLMAAWTDYRASALVGRIYGARISPAGAVIETNGFAITPSDEDHSTPKLAWDGTSFRIASLRRASPALALTSVDDLAQVKPGGATFADAKFGTHALTCGGGQCALGWTDTTNYKPMLARLDSSGTELGRVVLGASARLSSQPDLAFDGSRFVSVFGEAASNVVSSPDYNEHVFARAVGLDGTLDDGKPMLSVSANLQAAPSIAFNGKVYLLAWSDTRADGSADIWGARFAANGAILDPDGIQIASATDVQREPFVASNGSDFLVAWSDKRSGSSFDIFAARVAAKDGSVLDATPLALTTAAGDQVRPRIASDGADYLVIWSHNSWDIIGARVTASGQLPDTFGIPIADGAAQQVNPYLIWNGSEYALTWYENTSIVFSRLSAAGARLDSPAVSVISQSTAAVKPVMVATPAGHLILWVGVTGNLYSITLSAAGTAGARQTFATGATGTPVLLNDAEGHYLVAWENSGRAVLAREIDQFGAAVGTEVMLATNWENAALTPSGASAGPNRYAVAYARLEQDRPYLSTRVAWKIVSGATAQTCTKDADCSAGSCVDGFCCDAPCGGNVTTDCQACSVAAGAAIDGACGPVVATRICRAAANSCDVAESCNGSSTTCPSDLFVADETPCPSGMCSNGACAPSGGTGGTSGGTGGTFGGTGGTFGGTEGTSGGTGSAAGGTGSTSGGTGSAAGSENGQTAGVGAGASESAGAPSETGAAGETTSNGSGHAGAANTPGGATTMAGAAESPGGGRETSAPASNGASDDASCACRIGTRRADSSSLAFAATFALLARARRRRARTRRLV